MRALQPILLIVCLASCSEEPGPRERELIAFTEANVTLPPGAGSLACYERHYALVEDEDVATYLGADLPLNQLLAGHYILSERPGTVWHDDCRNLPRIDDGGCSLLRVFHAPGERDAEISASCSLTIAGEMPDAVEPPRTC